MAQPVLGEVDVFTGVQDVLMAQPVLGEVDVFTGVQDVGTYGVFQGVKVLLPAGQTRV